MEHSYKFYITSVGCFGMVSGGKYMLFSTEEEYYDFINSNSVDEGS